MSFKQVIFYVGCPIAWFILLPLLVIGGGFALLGYAVIAELTETLVGRNKKSLENTAAREIARRMCLRA